MKSLMFPDGTDLITPDDEEANENVTRLYIVNTIGNTKTEDVPLLNSYRYGKTRNGGKNLDSS